MVCMLLLLLLEGDHKLLLITVDRYMQLGAPLFNPLRISLCPAFDRIFPVESGINVFISKKTE